jgi:hypothetical protein
MSHSALRFFRKRRLTYDLNDFDCNSVRNDIDGIPSSRLSKSAENAGTPPRATVLAEPFRGTGLQGVALVFAKVFRGL